MISTLEAKEAQLKNGYYQSGSGPEQILILGSCRTLPYLSYLMRWNEGKNQFTIRRIDPCDWTVSNVDLVSLENNECILSAIKSTDIFIHEHLENYGMFNTDHLTMHEFIIKKVRATKNIYQFGMNAKVDIGVPNFHDRFVLFNDYPDCGLTTPPDYVERGEAAIEQFCKLCSLTSFSEMGYHFLNNWRTTRFFWRPNHVAAAFTLYIFRLMNDKFLDLALTDEFWAGAATEDLFKDPHTAVTQQDRDVYKLTW